MSSSFPIAQQKALAILPKITGLTSFFFSAILITSILRDKRKRQRPYQRLLVGISFVDLSASFWLSLSTWPIPRDSGVLWAVGTDATCNLQGFFTQFGVSSSFYNASLSIYYLMVVRYGWKDHQIRRIEPVLHAIPFLWAAITSIASVSLDTLGNASLWCWISPQSAVYRLCFFYSPLWLMIVIVTVNCIFIFKFVSQTERAVSRHDFISRRRLNGSASFRERISRQLEAGDLSEEGVGTAGEESTRTTTRFQVQQRRIMMRREASAAALNKRTKEVAIQSFLYAGAFYLNWFALTLTRLLQTINGEVYFPLLLISAMMVPIQGLPNFLVYLGPKFIKVRRERPNDGVLKWLHRSLGNELPTPAPHAEVTSDPGSERREIDTPAEEVMSENI